MLVLDVPVRVGRACAYACMGTLLQHERPHAIVRLTALYLLVYYEVLSDVRHVAPRLRTSHSSQPDTLLLCLRRAVAHIYSKFNSHFVVVKHQAAHAVTDTKYMVLTSSNYIDRNTGMNLARALIA